jgi:hypothetical protein
MAVPICRSSTIPCLCRPAARMPAQVLLALLQADPRPAGRARVDAPNTSTTTRTPARRASRAMQCCMTRLWHVRSAPSVLEHVSNAYPMPIHRASIRSAPARPSGAPSRSLAEGRRSPTCRYRCIPVCHAACTASWMLLILHVGVGHAVTRHTEAEALWKQTARCDSLRRSWWCSGAASPAPPPARRASPAPPPWSARSAAACPLPLLRRLAPQASPRS